jgi:hypothetical protein
MGVVYYRFEIPMIHHYVIPSHLLLLQHFQRIWYKRHRSYHPKQNNWDIHRMMVIFERCWSHCCMDWNIAVFLVRVDDISQYELLFTYIYIYFHSHMASQTRKRGHPKCCLDRNHTTTSKAIRERKRDVTNVLTHIKRGRGSRKKE